MKTLRPGLPRPDAVLLRLQLIGRMQALTLGNESVLPLGRKTRGLLAILALSGRKPVLRLRLAELLWSRRSEEQARASLRQEIHRLLEALSPLGTEVIAVERHTLALMPALTSVDAERILTANPSHAENLPSIAGVLLEELNGTDPALDLWLAAERARLHNHAVGLFEQMLQRQRDPQGMLDAARQLLLLEGLHERAWQATIQNQMALGHGVLARQSAERCLAAFAAVPGTEPGPEMRAVLAGVGFGQSPLDGTHTSQAEAPVDRSYPRSGEPDGTTEPFAMPSPNAMPGLESGERRGSIAGIPLIAVLPPLELDGPTAGTTANSLAGLSQGLVRTIEAALVGYSRLRLLVGSALDASLEQGRDDAVLRRSFAVDYVLDGTIQQAGGRVRLILRLTDIRQHGQLMWAERFDGAEQDPLGFLDGVAQRVAARLPSEIQLAESRRLRRAPESELDPPGMAVQAFSLFVSGDPVQYERGLALSRRSVERDPGLAIGHATLALAHTLRALTMWDARASETAAADASLRTALALDPSLDMTMIAGALIRSELQDQPEASLALLDRACSLTPYSVVIAAIRAYPLIRLGRIEDAARTFADYKTRFPAHPLEVLLDPPGILIPLLQGNDEAAARAGLSQTEIRPGHGPILATYLAALGNLGRIAEAERVRARLLTAWPGCTVSDLMERAGLRGPGPEERFAEGLRLAGLRDHATARPPVHARRPLGVDRVAG